MERQWPKVVQDFLRDYCGPLVAVERLGGMSGARVYRARGRHHSAIVKENASDREASVYQRLASSLHDAGIETPHLMFAYIERGKHWLILEAIPNQLPRDRWDADPAVLAMLSRLHALSLTLPADAPDLFVPRWTDPMTDQALTAFPHDIASSLAPVLRELQRQSQSLFIPQCWISGDPNPANWGLRDDGTLVLFDWDRLTRASPAIDLAITVPGLGDWSAFHRVATSYLAQQPLHRQSPRLTEEYADSLAADMARAKVWTVIGPLNEPRGEHTPQLKATTTWLTEAVPGWLQTLTPHLR